MKSVKILKAIVVLLVLLNCTLLAVFWMQRGKGPEDPPQRAHEFLTKELKLTKAQETAYEKMREGHFELTRKLNDVNRKLHDSLFAYIETPELDTPTVTRIEQQIAYHQTQLEKATLLHFRELRSILDAGQQQKFDGVIKDALRMMARPQRGGRPGPGGMPPPRDGHGPRPGQGPPDGQGPPPGEGFPPPPAQ